MGTQGKIKLQDKDVKKLEVISIVALIAFAFLSRAIIKHYVDKRNDNISIYVNGVQIVEVNGHKIDIGVDDTFVIGDRDRDYNIIEIKNKKVKCIDANCRDQICVKHGELNKEIDNDMIICAPHHLSIVYN